MSAHLCKKKKREDKPETEGLVTRSAGGDGMERLKKWDGSRDVSLSRFLETCECFTFTNKRE